MSEAKSNDIFRYDPRSFFCFLARGFGIGFAGFLRFVANGCCMSANEVTLNTVQAFLGAMGTRNLDAIVELFSEEVDWFIPGDETVASWLGKRKDKEGVRDFFSLLWPATEPLSAQVDHLFVDGNKAVVIGEFSTRMLATGKVVDSLFHIHLTVEGGLITRYRLLEDSLAVYRALGG